VDCLTRAKAEYCPPIDSALFSAIVSDYDIGDEISLQEVKSTLDALKASALEEEASGFDASGSGGQQEGLQDAQHGGSSPDKDVSPDSETNMTGLSHGVSSIGLTDTSSETSSLHDTDEIDLEMLDNDTKALLLQDVFPDMTNFTIMHTLKKCNYKWQRALDDLLNQSYLTETGETDTDHQLSAKGVDAFFEENNTNNNMGRGRRNKKKGKSQKSSEDNSRSSSHSYSPPLAPTPTNKWLDGSKDVDFIASRAKVDASLVRSTYYSNHNSVPATITYLLKDIMKSSSRIASSDPVVKQGAVELGREFLSIHSADLVALVRLTHPSLTAARELAKAMTTPRITASPTTPVTPQYAPLALSDEEFQSVGKKRPKSAQTPRSRSSEAGEIHNSSSTARHEMDSRAISSRLQEAARRARSNGHYGGVAAYYSQVQHDNVAASRRYISDEADKLVKTQSRAGSIDLHGVNVEDALRISRREVQKWWDELGENRNNGRIGANNRAAGFTIVVGKGHHSAGGVAKVGPAVSKALQNEGWRVEKGSGDITVRGRVKG